MLCNSAYTTVQGHQRLVRALFGQFAVLHDEDDVRVADRAETMGDDDGCSTLHQPAQGLHDGLLRDGVETGRRLVENQDRRVADDGAAIAMRWRWPPEKGDATLADHRVVTVGHRFNEFARVREFGRASDLF